MNVKKIVVVSSLVLSTLLLTSAMSFAYEEDTEEPKSVKELREEQKKKMEELREEQKEKMELRKDDFRQKKEEWKDARCNLVEQRIDGKIRMFEARKDFHIQRYQNIKTKVQAMIDRLKDEGYDTGKLADDLETLDSKIKEAAASYATFISKLRAAKEFDCGNSEGDFLEAMKSAQSAREEFHKDLKAVREFLTGTIKEDLKDLREQKKDKEDEEE